MIKFERNIELDKTMKNLMLSMVSVSDYLDNVLDYTGKVLTPKKEKELIDLLNKYDIPSDDLKYDMSRLTENPYYKNIKLDNVKTDTVWYENSIIKKRTLMSMNFHNPVGKYLFHYHPLGYFEEDVNMPVLKEGKDKVWMSPAISEIESMNDGYEAGHGDCLTLGLGIGVLPYLWLLKDEVNSVTIVEVNKDVIELFEKYLRPQFPKDKELKIINGDAFEYYNEEFLNQFDYVYVDFWESTEDGLDFYTRLMEKKINLPHIDFWIENSILQDVKYIVVPYLYALYQERSIADFMSSLDRDTRDIAKKVNRYFKSRNDLITTEDELLNIIHNRDVLREILGQ
ncbi:MAG: hypothetical protein RIN55_09195 [Tissierellaceae bacterium]|nr:hypothetical protein [Tissierellaceae bacterium]